LTHKDLRCRQDPLYQELNDRIFGISLVYGDLKHIRPNIDETNPDIKRNVIPIVENKVVN